MESFNYQIYLSNYPDLKDFDNLQKAFRHYQQFGKAEGRVDTPIINKIPTNSKFGVILFYNIICNYIAKCNNLKMNYLEFTKTKQLGIDLYIGENVYDSTLILNNKNIDSIMQNESVFSKNIIIQDTFKTSTVAKFIKDHLLKIKTKIISSNPYKPRYSANNDLFIHIRLNGIQNSNDFESFAYYDLIISKITYDTGYISSDLINHPICTKLIRKYNLLVINGDEIKTIQWGSTCKWIVLSKSMFSWLIGVFGFYSTIYYPERLGKKNKHGNIFIFKDWNKVNY